MNSKNPSLWWDLEINELVILYPDGSVEQSYYARPCRDNGFHTVVRIRDEDLGMLLKMIFWQTLDKHDIEFLGWIE